MKDAQRKSALEPTFEVLGDGSVFKERVSSEILPGDLLRLKIDVADDAELTAPCDLLVMRGTWMVSEAIITGESAPLSKYSMLQADASAVYYPEKEGKIYTVFGGSKIIKLYPDPVVESAGFSPVLASSSTTHCFFIAIRTGFASLQGQLMRSLLYHGSQNESKIAEKKYSETFWFLVCLNSLSLCTALLVWFQSNFLLCL